MTMSEARSFFTTGWSGWDMLAVALPSPRQERLGEHGVRATKHWQFIMYLILQPALKIREIVFEQEVKPDAHLLPILQEEIDDSVVVVDADLQNVWLELIPGQRSLPEDAPAINQSIAYVVEEKGTNIEGQTTVVVWRLERAASLLPESTDLWTPMRQGRPAALTRAMSSS
jgi:hypothetical protein